MKNRRGFTLLEMMISTGILLLVVTSATSVAMQAGHSFDRNTAQLDADRSASASVQRMMLDLEEAKQVTVQSTTSMRVFFPQVDTNGYYIRSALDNVNTIDYFLGTSAGVASTSGDCLVRQQAGGTARVVCSGVSLLQFSSTNPSSVDIQLRTQRACTLAPAERDMIHRAIFLRNY